MVVAMRVWHRFLNQEPRPDILEALNRARLLTYACESDSTPDAGIVFFDEVTDQLRGLLSETSRRGLKRVLAIRVCPTAIKPAAIWSLLHAGAADVLMWTDSREPANEVAARFERWGKNR